MITAKNNRKLTLSGVPRHYAGHSLADAGYETRVLHLADRWVGHLYDLFESVVSVKLNLPS